MVRAGNAAALALAAAALLALGAYGAHRLFATQCFSHHVPAFPNHGLSAVREAAPTGLAAADALLQKRFDCRTVLLKAAHRLCGRRLKISA